MVSDVIRWYSMVFIGIVGIRRDFFWDLLGFVGMCWYDGIQCYLMVLDGIFWYLMKFNGIRRDS